MTHLRIAIVGSRNITDYKYLVAALTEAIQSGFMPPAHTFEIVSGGAKGVDSLARRYALESGYKLTEFKPQYNGPNDRGAPLRRNKDIAQYCDVMLAIWDGHSPGTKNVTDYAKSIGKPVYVYKLHDTR